MFGSGDNLDVLQPGDAQAVGHKFRRPLHVRGMFGQSTDAGNAEESLQFLKEPVLMMFDERSGRL
jgi:hypothetical protein